MNVMTKFVLAGIVTTIIGIVTILLVIATPSHILNDIFGRLANQLLLIGFIISGIGIFTTYLPLKDSWKKIKAKQKSRFGVKSTRAFPKDVKERVLILQNYCCNVCGIRPKHLDHDHIIPHSEGGDNSESNCQALCLNCHRDKTLREKSERR
jgi:hypothetical protein